jgi:hypothetical protein
MGINPGIKVDHHHYYEKNSKYPVLMYCDEKLANDTLYG